MSIEKVRRRRGILLARKSVEVDVRFVNILGDFAQVFLTHDPHDLYRISCKMTYRSNDPKVVYHSQPIAKTSGDRIQSGGTHFKLFNLVKDPCEQNDLARSNQEPFNRMMSGLIASLEAKNAQHPIDENGNELRPLIPLSIQISEFRQHVVFGSGLRKGVGYSPVFTGKMYVSPFVYWFVVPEDAVVYPVFGFVYLPGYFLLGQPASMFGLDLMVARFACQVVPLVGVFIMII